MSIKGTDICDLLEGIAVQITTSTNQLSIERSHDEILQLATCPRSHAAVQGLVERQFHALHLRDFYSVINYLLLRYSLLNEQKQDKESVLKKQIHELQHKNKERKAKYEELYRINQQWSADYKDLQKQLLTNSEDHISPLSIECTHCTVYERELQEKKSLLINCNETIEKLEIKDKDWSVQLKEKEDTIQDLLNECSALRYQFQELGGLSVAMKLKDDKKELTNQLQKLKERNTDLERDRAQLQTQFNRFRQSVRQILFESTPIDHTHYHTTPPSYHDDVRIPPGMASNGYIYPKQFAPRNIPTVNYKTSHDISTSKQPPTPPGLISRSINGHYETHPYKPNTLTEQVIGGKPYPFGGHTSSQYLEPQPPTQLLSPVNVPRPMSAPGSLLLSSQDDQTPFTNVQDNKPIRPSVLKLDGYHSNIQNGYHSNNQDNYYSNAQDSYHSNTKDYYPSNTPTTDDYYCPHCNVSFPRQPESCDALIEHLTTCTH